MVGWNEEIKQHLGSCGENVFIGHNVIFTNPSEVHIGNNVHIDPFTLITTALEVGDNVQICSHKTFESIIDRTNNWFSSNVERRIY